MTEWCAIKIREVSVCQSAKKRPSKHRFENVSAKIIVIIAHPFACFI
jgi:hypothetical protein